MLDWLGDTPKDKFVGAVVFGAIGALGIAFYRARCVEISPLGLASTIDGAGMTGDYPFELYYRGPDGRSTLQATIPDTATLYSGLYDTLSPEYCVQKGKER